MVEIAMKIYFFNIENVKYQIGYLHTKTKVMNLLIVSFPLELIEVFHNFGVEYLVLITLTKTVKQIVHIGELSILVISYRRKHVDGVLDFIELLHLFQFQ